VLALLRQHIHHHRATREEHHPAPHFSGIDHTDCSHRRSQFNARIPVDGQQRAPYREAVRLAQRPKYPLRTELVEAVATQVIGGSRDEQGASDLERPHVAGERDGDVEDVFKRPGVDHCVELLVDVQRRVEIVDYRGSFEVRGIDRLKVAYAKQRPEKVVGVVAERRWRDGQPVGLTRVEIDLLATDRQGSLKRLSLLSSRKRAWIWGYVSPMLA
jgi:hypothetical protein